MYVSGSDVKDNNDTLSIYVFTSSYYDIKQRRIKIMVWNKLDL